MPINSGEKLKDSESFPEMSAMRIYLKLTLLCALISSNGVAHSTSCDAYAAFARSNRVDPVHRGTARLDHRDLKRNLWPYKVPPGAVVRRLGGGPGGGEVFLFEMPTGETFVIKKYYVWKGARRDQRLLEILATMRMRHPDPFSFHVIRSELLGEDLMKLEYVSGRTLEHVLNDSLVPEPARKELAEAYRKCLDNFQKALRREFPSAVVEIDSNNFIKVTENGALTKFFLAPPNVLVTPDGRLVVIDPY